MASNSLSSAILVILNILNIVFGLAITAGAIWFFVELRTLTNLRNPNHYLLDYNVYWPQAVPWMFIFAGMFVLFVSCCGFAGTKKQSRGVLSTYVIFQGIAVVLLIVATVLTLVFADSDHSDKFVKDTLLDAFRNSDHKTNAATPFGLIERKYQCCGASEPRDYLQERRSQQTFPPSCCDTYYHGWSTGEIIYDCDLTNKSPNERLGCAEVVPHYTRIALKVFSAAAIFTAFIGLLNLLVAIKLSRSLKRRNPVAVTAQNEFESKKVLL